MRKNIIIICYNYALSRRLAAALAERFDMRIFDMYEMFKFHNMPLSLAEVMQINGEEFVDKKMRGILKDELEFLDVIFVADTKIIGKNQDLFDKLKENNIVVFLKDDFKTEYAQRERINFVSEEEKTYFSLEVDELNEIEKIIEKNFADIVVEISNLNYDEIKGKLLEKLGKI